MERRGISPKRESDIGGLLRSRELRGSWRGAWRREREAGEWDWVPLFPLPQL